VTLLLPAALVALVVVPIIYLIHLLHGSRRRVRVPALFLWADLPRAASGRERRRWPPPSLLLILQLLAAGLAAFALTRPASSSDPPRHVVLIVDASASMLATDVAPNRFEAARARAGERLRSLKGTDTATLIRAGTGASMLATGSPGTVQRAVSSMQAGLGGSAIRDALALAATQLATTPDRSGQIVVLSDVAWPVLAPVGALGAPVEVVAVGGGGENQSVSTVQVRMDPSGRAQTAFVEITNAADHPVRVPVRLTADDAPLDQREIDLPARGLTRLSVPLATEVHSLGVRLLGRDALSLDDSATSLAPGGPPRDVVLVGRPSAALRRALESIPFVRLQVLDPTVTERPRVDLTVLDGILPQQLPAGPLLLVDPPASSARLLGVGIGSGARVHAAHPLMQGLDLAALRGETPTVSGVPGWAHVVLGNIQGPLVMEGRLEGHPIVVLTFDPAMTGLEKSLAYPLLISNATTFLLTPTNVASEPFDAAESDIQPRPAPAFDAATSTVEASAGWVERWPWLAVAVLLVLAAEWVAFARRG
jgi:hypothetical protein